MTEREAMKPKMQWIVCETITKGQFEDRRILSVRQWNGVPIEGRISEPMDKADAEREAKRIGELNA